jgi:uncharacterized small protein (DUF1192 family)
MQASQADIKARIAEIRQEFERLSRRCNSFVRISPETVNAYKAELARLEAQLN